MEMVKVLGIINRDTAVSTDDGQKVFEVVSSHLSQEQKTEMDFAGIQFMTTAFLNVAIGQLYSTFTGDQLKNQLSLTNVAEEDLVLFKKVVDRAKEYFAAKQDFDNSADNAIYGH